MKKTESERLKNVLKRKAKLHSQRQKTSKKKNDVPKTPINESMLTIREMKPNDKLNIQRMLSDFRRDYYISVYKGIFRSWFAYALTAGLLAISLTFLRSNLWAVCAPPILVTILLLWRVNRYKSYNQTFTVHDMELLCENETPYYKFKSTESRRINQGVLVAFVQEKKRPRIDEMELAELNESDIDELDDSELEEVLAGRDINLVGYLIYGKQKDELETVAIKEICIDSDYRKRHVATYFLKKASRLLHDFGYRRFAFQASTFNIDLLSICEKKPNLITKIYTWTAYQFLPGVFDNRTVYSIDFKQLNKLFN